MLTLAECPPNMLPTPVPSQHAPNTTYPYTCVVPSQHAPDTTYPCTRGVPSQHAPNTTYPHASVLHPQCTVAQ
ncbi:hypothetical protein O181_128400 [Austropuccinia psidii MF-1]|uniref:Uncharacterized protein n=1 Tax=Austropuccinia psidii MF-1 TaxID=1389203 RepID=A0A9Q3L036_9BASI|nr:hypothetical protein [Austropuccinia psidii MF-1]